MSDNWNAIEGFDGWSAKLDELLDAATAAIQADDIEARVLAQRRLRMFKRKSPNEICRKLDRIAGQAITDIFNETVVESLKAISARSRELDEYVLELRSVTESASRSASWISLESPIEIVRSLGETIDAVDEVAEAFKDAENAEDIEKGVASLKRAAKKLRAAVSAAAQA